MKICQHFICSLSRYVNHNHVIMVILAWSLKQLRLGKVFSFSYCDSAFLSWLLRQSAKVLSSKMYHSARSFFWNFDASFAELLSKLQQITPIQLSIRIFHPKTIQLSSHKSTSELDLNPGDTSPFYPIRYRFLRIERVVSLYWLQAIQMIQLPLVLNLIFLF